MEANWITRKYCGGESPPSMLCLDFMRQSHTNCKSGRILMKKAAVSLLRALVFMVAANTLLFGQSSDESAGRTAEQTGKWREALTHYVAALQSVSEGTADDQRVRETIIRVVQKLSPPPAVPEEARRFSIRGQIAIKEAKSAADFDEAAKEFGKALRLAPWWADGYINQGVALEKAGKFNEAARALKFYLLAAPNAPDAQNVRDQIYALEYRQEKAQRDAATRRHTEEAKAAAEQRRRDEEQRAKMRTIESWSGIWATGGMRWQVTISGNNINIAYYESYNYRTQRWGSNHPCPENWQGVITETLELSLTMYLPESCAWTPRPPTMRWPVAGRIDFDKKMIWINEGRYWGFEKGWVTMSSSRGYPLVPD